MASAQGPVLMTGGCGYIGSHVACRLSEMGTAVAVVDDLSTGHRNALLHDEAFLLGNCGDRGVMERAVRESGARTLMHFAGSILVAESVANPLGYYENNVSQFISLLRAAETTGIKHVVLSSSASVYGHQGEDPLAEEAPTVPVNPYGRSKLAIEWVLQDWAAVTGASYAILRYFNVAGADRDQRIGQQGPNATHLIKMASRAATGDLATIQVYGDDYPTADGTCVRDYVHVEDLAAAHVAAGAYLEGGGASVTLNCGYGRGYSVTEVLDTADSVVNSPLPRQLCGRRPGDPPVLIADNRRILATLDWKPERADLGDMIRSAIRWEEKLARQRQIG